MSKKEQPRNRAKDFLVGMLGSVAGLWAMGYYWQTIAPKVKESLTLGGTEAYPQSLHDSLDNISQVGKQYKEGESSTDALGRMMYKSLMGKEPQSDETKEFVSYLAHWVYGIVQGGLYGMFRASGEHGLDLKGGAMHATGLWLFGDEVAVPMLGLQEGPTATEPTGHINRWGAHLFYGLATAVATRILGKIF